MRTGKLSFIFVGRGHDPAEAPIQLSGRFCAEILDFTSISASQFRYLVGGVMTPPYEMVLR